MCAIIIPCSSSASYLVAGGDCQMSEKSTVTLSLSHNSPQILQWSGGVMWEQFLHFFVYRQFQVININVAFKCFNNKYFLITTFIFPHLYMTTHFSSVAS